MIDGPGNALGVGGDSPVNRPGVLHEARYRAGRGERPARVQGGGGRGRGRRELDAAGAAAQLRVTAVVESITQLVGHAATAVTEAVYRKELRPVLTDGAEVIGSIFTRNKSAG